MKLTHGRDFRVPENERGKGVRQALQRMLRYFLFFISFLAEATTLAAPLSAERASALLAQFQTRQRATLTWWATVVQTLTLPGVRDPVVSMGQLAYRAPDRLRLDYTKPAGEFVLVLGDRLFIQKTGARLAEKSLREDSAGKPFLLLLGLLRGQPAEEQSDYTPEVTREEDRYAVVLRRNDDASSHMPARIINTIAAETLEVREVVVDLPSGGVLSYRFDDITRNGPLEAAHFTAPAVPTSRELRGAPFRP
ncbi:MAG: outer membrane lipoprotein carrier protein LolA [Chromatiales bacterium]